MSNLAVKVREQLEEKSLNLPQRNASKWLGITKGEKSLIFFFLIATFIMSVKYIGITANLYVTNVESQKLQEKINQQTIINQELEGTVKELTAPERVLDVARKNGLEIKSENIRVINNQ